VGGWVLHKRAATFPAKVNAVYLLWLGDAFLHGARNRKREELVWGVDVRGAPPRGLLSCPREPFPPSSLAFLIETERREESSGCVRLKTLFAHGAD
jgi:hypothetical protein